MVLSRMACSLVAPLAKASRCSSGRRKRGYHVFPQHSTGRDQVRSSNGVAGVILPPHALNVGKSVTVARTYAAGPPISARVIKATPDTEASLAYISAPSRPASLTASISPTTKASRATPLGAYSARDFTSAGESCLRLLIALYAVKTASWCMA